MLSRSRFENALDEMEPLVKAAFIRAVQGIKSRARLEMLERAIAAGRIDLAMQVLGVRPGSWSVLTEAIREAFVVSGELTAAGAPAALGFAFNVNHRRAEQWLMENSSRLVTNMDADTRAVIRLAMNEGLRENAGPRQTARKLIGHLNRGTGRRQGGIIGLTRPQAVWVDNAARELASGSRSGLTNYLGRAQRDRRFDPIVERALREGRAVAAGDIRRMIGRYSDRLLQHRAETISRTETLQAMSKARDEAVSQAADEGLLKRESITRIWRTASDSRVRDFHQPMNGQRRAEGEPFLTGDGRYMKHPGDHAGGPQNVIQCRCSLAYEVDWITEAGLERRA